MSDAWFEIKWTVRSFVTQRWLMLKFEVRRYLWYWHNRGHHYGFGKEFRSLLATMYAFKLAMDEMQGKWVVTGSPDTDRCER